MTKTAEIASEFKASNLRFFDFQERRGKISILNDLIERAEEQVLVFSDANTFFQADAIHRLAQHFLDPRIGAVCGELHLIQGEAGEDNQDSLYWRYEQTLKKCESDVGGLLGANGAIYAIRKPLYQPLPKDTIVDDFTVVMKIASQGYQVRYDPEAIAHEEVAPAMENEFNRRIRIGAGQLSGIFSPAAISTPDQRCLLVYLLVTQSITVVFAAPFNIAFPVKPCITWRTLSVFLDIYRANQRIFDMWLDLPIAETNALARYSHVAGLFDRNEYCAWSGIYSLYQRPFARCMATYSALKVL